MEHGPAWTQRRDVLLAKLAARAEACPGLYPLRKAEDFLRVAEDHAKEGIEDICRVLEAMWQRPEDAVQLNAQSLIRRGQGLKHKATDGEVTLRGIQGFRG